jgi:hypothetical protein
MLKITCILSLTVVLLLLLGISMSACSTSVQSSLPEPSYSREITENIMLAINNNNFPQYSRDFDQTMKQAMTEQAFEQVQKTVTSKIGSYVPASLQFSKTVAQDKYIVVNYLCKFTGEPDSVTVTISFQAVDGKYLVAGLYFNSPKLRN